MPRQLLTPTQAATYINVAPETLRYWRNSAPRRGPDFIKVEGQVRYRPEVVEAWLEANTVETAA